MVSEGKLAFASLGAFVFDNTGFSSPLLSASESLRLVPKFLLHGHSSSLSLPVVVTIILSIQWKLMKILLPWSAYIRTVSISCMSCSLWWHHIAIQLSTFKPHRVVCSFPWTRPVQTMTFGFQLQVGTEVRQRYYSVLKTCWPWRSRETSQTDRFLKVHC